MSSLLKNNSEGIATFGFPLIAKSAGEPAPPPSEEQPGEVETEVSAEEIYRVKLLELERRTQEIERDAYTKGFAQGEKDGLDYGQKSVQVVCSQIERIAQKMESLPAKVLEDYRDWLIRTSMEIAEKIVGREILTSPEIVADLVGELIEEAEQHSTLTVYLNSNDLEIIEKKALLTPGKKHFELRADKQLDRGGCRVESSIQLLEGSVAAMFENLKALRKPGERS